MKSTMPPLFDSPEGKKILAAWRGRIRCIASDVDGTLTIEGKDAGPTDKGTLSPEAHVQIRILAKRKMPVILVTGRPLPTVEGLAMYLGLVDRERMELGNPIVAENGAIYKCKGEIVRLSDQKPAMRAAKAVARDLGAPENFLTFDNYVRYCDVGVDSAAARPTDVTEWLSTRPKLGLKTFTSNIMTHIVQSNVDKADALRQVLRRMRIPADSVLVCGDSDTDLPLFRAFPMSLAVANYFTTVKDAEAHAIPALRSRAAGGKGFAEVVKKILG